MLFAEKRGITTSKFGIGLSRIIKTGIDNPGHPNIKTVGVVACDEESFETFGKLFKPIIEARHGGLHRRKKGEWGSGSGNGGLTSGGSTSGPNSGSNAISSRSKESTGWDKNIGLSTGRADDAARSLYGDRSSEPLAHDFSTARLSTTGKGDCPEIFIYSSGILPNSTLILKKKNEAKLNPT
jgi:hypothetical protein